METVAKWRAEQESKVQTEIAEVDQEIGSLTTAISNLQQQMEGLAKFRGELLAKQSSVGDGEGAQIYGGIFGALTSQAATLAERGATVLAAENARRATIAAAISDPETKALMDEYEQFKTTVEPTLAGLPASYRGVIEQHHVGVTEKLKARLADADTGPASVEGDSITIDVVFGVDAPEGQAEIIMVVLPVADSVKMDWSNRQDDLQTALAARAMQAVYQACKSIGFPTAQAMYGGHQGLLAVELELPGGDPGPIQSALQTALDQILGDAPELNAAKVQAKGHYSLVDNLLPPEEDEAAAPQEMTNA